MLDRYPWHVPPKYSKRWCMKTYRLSYIRSDGSRSWELKMSNSWQWICTRTSIIDFMEKSMHFKIGFKLPVNSIYTPFLNGFTWLFTVHLYLYISSCHKAHKALTFSFHPLRFAAKALTVVHDCHPATRLSSSTILLHVVFGRPGLLLPSGLHSNAVTQCSSLFFLNICPIQFHLRHLISSLILFTPVVSWICLQYMIVC